MGGLLSSSSDKGHEEKLLNEYKEKLYKLDDAVVGLFIAVDVMVDVTASLTQDIQAAFDCTDQDQKDSLLKQCRKLAAGPFTTTKHAVAHQKKVTKHDLLSLYGFINNAIIENAKSVDVTFSNFTIANYEDDVRLLKSHKEKNHIDALSFDIEEKTEEIKSLKKVVEILKERETTFIKEEKLQDAKIQLLHQESDKLRKVIDEMLQQENTYKKDLDSLTIKLQSLQKKHHDDNLKKEQEICELKQEMERLNAEKEREEQMQLEKIKLLKKQSNDFGNKIDELTTQNGNLQFQLQQADTDKKDLDSLTVRLQSMQEEHGDENVNNEKKICELNHRIENLNATKEKEEKLQLEKTQLLEQQSTDLRNKIDELTAQNGNLKSQLQQASTYKKDLDSLNTTLQSMQDSLYTTLQSMQEEHLNKISNYKKKINVLKQKLESENASKKEIERQLGEEKIEHEKIQLLEQQAVSQSLDLQKKIDNMKLIREEMGKQLENFQHKTDSLSQTNKQLEETLKKSEKESEDRTKEYLDLQQFNSTLEQEKKVKDKLIKELSDKYINSRDLFEKSKRKFDMCEQKTEDQEKLIHELEKEKIDTSKQHADQVLRLQKNVENLYQEKDFQLQLTEELNNNVKGYKDEVKRLKHNLEEEIGKRRQEQELNRNHETELEKKDKEIADQKSQNGVLENVIERHQRKYDSLKREKEEQIRNIHKENNKLNETICRLKETISAEKESFRNLEQVVKAKETENTRLSTQLKLIRDELKKVQLEYASKKEELELIKNKKTVPVQLYTHKRSEMTDNVEKTIIHLLQKEFVSDRLELEFWKCSRISDIHPNYPLLVICVTVSRIGTDVANAIHGISLSPNMAVVVFHHKDEHALPNQLSERILTGKELKDIGGIFDMAYFSGKGIYPCEMNRNSADSLVTFIKRVAKNIHP